MKGQGSTEYTVLFTVSVFLTLLFFGVAVLNVRTLFEQKKEYEVEKVLNEWEFIAKDVWINGNNSVYVWEGSLPEGYESSKSSIKGNSIVLVVDGKEFVKSFEEFTISGSTPLSREGIKMKIENSDGTIVFTPL